MTAPTPDDLHELRRRLEEAEETLRAIQSGEVDALVLEGEEGAQVYTLRGADYPYRALIEAMQQGAVSLSGDGTILYCNRCFAEMVNTPQEKIIGSAAADFVPSAQRSAFEELLRQGRAGKSQGELQFRASEGPLLPVIVALSPLPLEGAVALCMVVTDLTERKQHHNLQEESRRKDEFLAMLAHELRNPLAPIQSAVSILRHVDVVDEKLTYARDVVDRQVRHLARLVGDLLDVSRVTLGKVQLAKERVDLATVIARAVETSRPLIDARGHRLTISIPPRAAPVEADPIRLAQVIGNLLTNAAKYTDPGGEISVALERQAEEAVIRVRDTGMGISADLLPQVFDLFIQGERSLARSEGGLGLGLTLVRRLVELHGGTVEASSEGTGKGSEFTVRLPAPAGQHAGESEAVRDDRPRHGARRNVLIVEDNIDAAQTLAMLLNLAGHQAQIAFSGDEAMDKARALRPEVVLLDIGLPGMSGYSVARQLRAEPGFAGTILIAMTGYSQEEDRRRSREAGFNHHLVKPVKLEVLKELLESFE